MNYLQSYTRSLSLKKTIVSDGRYTGWSTGCLQFIFWLHTYPQFTLSSTIPIIPRIVWRRTPVIRSAAEWQQLRAENCIFFIVTNHFEMSVFKVSLKIPNSAAVMLLSRLLGTISSAHHWTWNRNHAYFGKNRSSSCPPLFGCSSDITYFQYSLISYVTLESWQAISEYVPSRGSNRGGWYP